MAFNPTKQQADAINTDGGVLVSAAAGSGKTAVLVERVIRKLTDRENPVSADRLLIVTFTNAAAEEMRGRIEKRIADECVANPGDIHLFKQKHLISCADICTIDSFCINLVRENFHLFGVEPDFKVGDESTVANECRKILQETVNEQLSKHNETFLKLLSMLDCQKDVENFITTVDSIYKYSLYMPFPNEFLKKLYRTFEGEFNKDNECSREIIRIAKLRCAQINKYAEKAKQDALLMNDCTKHLKYAEDFCSEFENVVAATLSEDYETLYNAVSVFKNFRAANKTPTKPSKDDMAVYYRDDFAVIKGIEEKLFDLMLYSKEEIERQNAELLPIAKLLSDIVSEYSEKVLEMYKEMNFLSFSVIEQMAFSLLCRYENDNVLLNEEAREYLSRYDEVLVDEFQDVNNLQNMLFSILSDNESHLFAVGDVKQSIYRFRGSNPKNFLEKKERFVPIELAKESEPKKIILADNFRSRDGICEYANFFFSLVMNSGVGGIEYNEEERLNAGAHFPETQDKNVEIVIADKSSETDEAATMEYEGRCIAKRIAEIMNGNESIKLDDNTLRKASYGDFVVLMPAVKGKARTIAQVLEENAIPVSFASEKYTETYEISVMLSLLSVIDNPYCDIDMLNVLFSALFSFTADEVAEIASEYKFESLYLSLLESAKNGNVRVQEFLDRLKKLRYDSQILQLNRFINKISTESGHLDRVSAMDCGKERRNNLLRLSSFANDYISNGGRTLSGFVKYIKQLPDTAFENGSVSNSDAVKIMTIHHSKGLQFPICFIAGISSQANNMDSVGSVLYNEKFGVGIKWYDYESEDYIPSASHRVISNSERLSTVEERIRLIYVAFTRAQDRLIIINSCKNIEDKLNKLNVSAFDDDGNIDYTWLSNCSVVSDWVLATALRHGDCDRLRNMVSNPPAVLESKSGLKLSFEVNVTEKTVINANKKPVFDENDLSSKIKERINYVYPFEELGSVRAKTSVSQLAKSDTNDRYSFSSLPDFMFADGLSASKKGTAAHKIVELIDFTENVDVKAEIERLVEWQFITEQQAKAVNVSQLETFFESDLYKRILKSNEVRREMRFLSEIPAKRLKSDISDFLKNEPVIIQGAIDLCFIEDDGVVVVDFKTDRVDDQKELLNLYGEQLSIYSDACEKIFGKKVKERIIYSFALSKEISL